MSLHLRVAAFAALLAFVTGAAGAQSLGELAAKEKERRKSLKPTKVYTDSDLKKSGGSEGESSVASSTDAAAANATATTEASTTGDDREAAQTTWRESIRGARQELRTLESRNRELQALITAQTQFGTADADVLAQVQETNQKLTETRANVDTLEREGRFKGYRE